MGIQGKINKLIKKAAAPVKVNDQELHNLRLRTMLKENKELELYILNNELRQYINLLLQKYEKSGTEYTIDLNSGEIKEIERPKLEEQPEVSAKETVKE